MTIKTIQKLETLITVPGLSTALGSEVREFEVTYTATHLRDFDGTRGIAEFTMTLDGQELADRYRLDFKYSGKGSPLEEAEKALQEFMEREPLVPEDDDQQDGS